MRREVANDDLLNVNVPGESVKEVLPVRRLYKLLSSHKFPLTSEKELQSTISSFLSSHAIEHKREVRLSPGDCIDFVVEGQVGIEVKLQGSAAAIFRQCQRYCESPLIHEFLLVSNRSMGFPPEINSKPVYVLSLGKVWL